MAHEIGQMNYNNRGSMKIMISDTNHNLGLTAYNNRGSMAIEMTDNVTAGSRRCLVGVGI